MTKLNDFIYNELRTNCLGYLQRSLDWNGFSCITMDKPLLLCSIIFCHKIFCPKVKLISCYLVIHNSRSNCDGAGLAVYITLLLALLTLAMLTMRSAQVDICQSNVVKTSFWLIQLCSSVRVSYQQESILKLLVNKKLGASNMYYYFAARGRDSSFMAYTWRILTKGVPYTDFRYMKGQRWGISLFKYMKG